MPDPLDAVRDDPEVQDLREDHAELIAEGKYRRARHFANATLIPAEWRVFERAGGRRGAPLTEPES